MDHSDSDCLVVALLSHGNDGSVYAYDAAFPTQVNRLNINRENNQSSPISEIVGALRGG